MKVTGERESPLSLALDGELNHRSQPKNAIVDRGLSENVGYIPNEIAIQ